MRIYFLVTFQYYKYWVTQKLPQIYSVNHATVPIKIRKIIVQICGNFLVTQYNVCVQETFSLLNYFLVPSTLFMTFLRDSKGFQVKALGKICQKNHIFTQDL